MEHVKSTKASCCDDDDDIYGLKKLRLFILEKGRMHGNFIATSQYVEGTYKEAGEGLLIGIVLIGQEGRTSN